MLVLTRRTGEGIEIEGGVTIQVLRTQRGRVRLGIVAPKSVRVNRVELPDRHAASGEKTPQVDPCSLAEAEPGS
jgi:carbon storage regulator